MGGLVVATAFFLAACATTPSSTGPTPGPLGPGEVTQQAPVAVVLEANGVKEAKSGDPTGTAAILQPGGTPAPLDKRSSTAITAQTLTKASSTPAPTGSPTPDTRKLPKYWSEWPLLPTVSARAKEIFLHGQTLGNNPHAFSVIGDCQSEPNILMGAYDTGEYELDEGQAYLEDTIQQFKGSFLRDNITVKNGMSAASVFAPAWADPKQCKEKETPLECEFRLNKPVIVIISLGTTWNGGDEKKHAEYMRRIIDYAISQGVVPVLSSKGDNQEGDHRINRSIAEIAYEYDLPFWNFWLAIRDLPGKGIDGTRPGGYLIPDAWERRSFTGLQALDAVWRELKPLLK